MTVHRALAAQALDIRRLGALPESVAAHVRSDSVVNLGRRGAALNQQLEDDIREVEEGEYCLVAVDVMNQYGKPFEVRLAGPQGKMGRSLLKLQAMS